MCSTTQRCRDDKVGVTAVAQNMSKLLHYDPYSVRNHKYCPYLSYLRLNIRFSLGHSINTANVRNA